MPASVRPSATIVIGSPQQQKRSEVSHLESFPGLPERLGSGEPALGLSAGLQQRVEGRAVLLDPLGRFGKIDTSPGLGQCRRLDVQRQKLRIKGGPRAIQEELRIVLGRVLFIRYGVGRVNRSNLWVCTGPKAQQVQRQQACRYQGEDARRHNHPRPGEEAPAARDTPLLRTGSRLPIVTPKRFAFSLHENL